MQVRQFTIGDCVYSDSVDLRERHLRAPLGLSLDDEDLSEEKAQLHFGLFEGDRLLGSVTFKIVNESRLKLRQMVIDESAQGSGLGTMLIRGAEMAVKELGYCDVEMAARLAVKGFYEKLGYVAQGDVFVEVKIEHIKMVKCGI
jgi:predicted GNAT family N-acyltransferase